MKISKIHIENFRSIRNKTLEYVKNVLILIEKNNVGKSAVVNAIRDLVLDKDDFTKAKKI